MPLVSTNSHHNSLNITGQQEAPNLNFIFDSPYNSEILTSSSLHKISKSIFSMPTRKPSSRLQRFRKGWNQQKFSISFSFSLVGRLTKGLKHNNPRQNFSITRLLTVCYPCAKISSTKD